MKTLSSIRIVIIALAVSVPVWAGSVVPIISHDGNETAIHLTQATDLRNVLERLCAGTNMQCEISTDAASITVPSMRITGVLSELVSKLLEGTNLNYVLMDATEGGPGRLLVTTQSPAPTSLPLNSVSPDQSASGQFGMSYLPPSGIGSRESEAQPQTSGSTPLSGASLGVASPVVAGAAAGETFSGAVEPTAEQISEDAIRRMYAPPKYRRGAVMLPTDEVGNPNQVPSQTITTDSGETP